MSAAPAPRWAGVEVGDALPPLRVALTRAALVRYAGASGDFNPIHYSHRVATAVGLPDVIAHGMLTMATAARVVTAWTGDPGAVVEYGVRMTRPVVVPDDDAGAVVEVAARVAEKPAEGLVRVELTATCAGEAVLGRATALVRLA